MAHVSGEFQQDQQPGPRYKISAKDVHRFRQVEEGKIYFQKYERMWHDTFGMTVDEYWDMLYPNGKIEHWPEAKLQGLSPWTKYMYINLNHIYHSGKWIGAMDRAWGRPMRLMNMADLARARQIYWNKVVNLKDVVRKNASAVFCNKTVSIRAAHLESDRFIDPHFTEQGETGDCWLISGFSAMAQRKEKLKSVFVPTRSGRDPHVVNHNPRRGGVGYYKLRLWNPFADDGEGRWDNVLIDDYIPVVLDSDGYPTAYSLNTANIIHDGSLLHTLRRRHEQSDVQIDMVIWPVLLEKAWSQWQWTGIPSDAGYTALDIRNQGGLMSIGILGMMGPPMETHRFTRAGHEWLHDVLDMDSVQTRYSERNWTWARRYLAGYYADHTWTTLDSLTPQQLVNQYLLPAGDAGYPMTCDKDNQDVEGHSFVSGHAYSVTIGSPLNNLPRINVRNPWGCDALGDNSCGGDTIIRHWYSTEGTRYVGFLEEFSGIVIMKQKGHEMHGFGDLWVDGIKARKSMMMNLAGKQAPGGNLWRLLPLSSTSSRSHAEPPSKRARHA
eukprot:TRINITY_DN41329_c0_g1_i1.p1 TRINITY_DN41329_c0_g1~~TRINITY_DN41329_c0_g1_i1.p1  ORF type:complete len:589 (-),score=47.42 TRINITY_DN41329_c0_g1_i1:82-1737(-)